MLGFYNLKDVTGRLPNVIRGAHHDEDADDDIQSLKSLPAVSLRLRGRDTVRKAQGSSDSSVPLLVTSK